MDNEQKSTETTPVAVECPNCKHKFWHKLGHALEKVAEGAAEVGIEVATGGLPGVPR